MQQAAPQIQGYYNRIMQGIAAGMGHEAAQLEDVPQNESAYSPREWIQENLNILSENRGIIRLKYTVIQNLLMDLVDALRERRIPIRLLILKARRQRVSTWAQSVIFEDTIHHEGIKSLIVGHDDDSKGTIFNMARLFLDDLHPEEKPMVNYSSKKELDFQNPNSKERFFNPGLRSSYKVAIAKRKDIGISQLVHNSHFSEVDRWGAVATEIMQGVLPTIPAIPQSINIMETTARHGGFGGEFFRRWSKAVAMCVEEIGKNQSPFKWNNDERRLELNQVFLDRFRELAPEEDSREAPYIAVFIPWFANPDYVSPLKRPLGDLDEDERELREKYNLSDEQLNFRRITIRDVFGGNVDAFKEEYPADDRECWYGAIRSRFSTASLQRYEQELENLAPLARGDYYLINGELAFEEEKRGFLKIYAWPEPGQKYVIGGDASAGVKDGDPASGTVEDLRSGEQMAEWHGLIDPDLFGIEMYKLALAYNKALIGIENEKHGITALKTLWDGKPEKGIPPYRNVMIADTQDRDEDVMTHELGWPTNKTTRHVLIDDLAEVIRECRRAYKSAAFIMECFRFVMQPGGRKFEAAPGCHDDRVISAGVCEQTRQWYYRKKGYG